MYYTIYKVTNKINGKFYIGSHKTKNLDDNYMGSGKYLKHSQEKHGIENFTKEILFVYDNPEDMYAKEAEIVNEDFLAEENTYNLKVGGFGGWDHINKNEDIRKEKNQRAGRTTRDNGGYKKGLYTQSILIKNQEWIRKRSNAFRQTIKEYYSNNDQWNKGIPHKEETKKKIGLANKKLKGPKNSQFGTMWIYNCEEKICKKIKKGDPIPDGWLPGRKIKWDG